MKKAINSVGVVLATMAAIGFMGLVFHHARTQPIDGLRLYDSDRVVDVVYGSPAYRAGIQAGDRIVAIDGQPVDNFDKLFARSRGVRHGDTPSYTYRRGREDGRASLSITAPPFPQGNALGMAVGLILIGCAYAAYLRAPGSEGARVFVAISLCLGMAFTVIGDWMRVASSPTLMKLYFFPVMLLPGLMLHFLLVFPERSSFAKGMGSAVMLVHLPGLAIFVSLFASMGRFVIDGEVLSPRFVKASAWAAYAAIFLGIGMVGGGTANLYQTMKATRQPLVREQAKWVFLGLGVLPVFFAVAAVQILGNLDHVLAGSYFPFSIWAGFLVLAVTMMLSVYRYKLDKIDRIIRTTVAYGLTFGLCAGLFKLLSSMLMGSGSVGVADAYTVAAFCAMAIFYPISRSIANFAESSIAQDEFKLEDKMKGLMERYSELIDPTELYETTLTGMLHAVQSDVGAIFAWNEKTLSFRPAVTQQVAKDIEIQQNSPLIPQLRGKQMAYRSWRARSR